LSYGTCTVRPQISYPLVQLQAYPQANHYTMTTPPPSPSTSTASQGKKNAAPSTTPTMNTDYAKTVNVKKVPFDGTEASFYLWTTHVLGFADTYNCAQALLGTITVPPASAVLSDADPDEHKLLQGRRANSTAMVLLRV
jgi:hypothetical protein